MTTVPAAHLYAAPPPKSPPPAAKPSVSLPSKAKAGQVVHLSGAGFSPGTKVKILFDASPGRPGGSDGVVVGTAVARPNGQFHMSVVVPKARPGRHTLQVEGTSASGKPARWASGVMVLTDVTKPLPDAGDGLAQGVLLALSIGLPIGTWVALQVPVWHRRRLARLEITGTRDRG